MAEPRSVCGLCSSRDCGCALGRPPTEMPPHASDPVETRMVALPKPLLCVHCGQPILVTEEHRVLNDYGEVRHVRDCERWKPSGPVSDGTLRCPDSHNGLPCQRFIPKGWHENEGHSGGHWFQSNEQAEAMRTGTYDARAALAGEPFTIDQSPPLEVDHG